MSLCERTIDLITDFDIPSWLNGARSFRTKLFDLLAVADSKNLEKLREVYPNEVEAYLRWIA